MADFVATHRITHEASMKMLAAGVAKANEIGCKISLAVVDASGQLIGFLMMDGARFFSGRTTIKKYRFADAKITPDAKVRSGVKELLGNRILNDEVQIQ